MQGHKPAKAPAVTLSILKKDPQITLNSELDSILYWIRNKHKDDVALSDIAILCRRKKTIPKITEYLKKMVLMLTYIMLMKTWKTIYVS